MIGTELAGAQKKVKKSLDKPPFVWYIVVMKDEKETFQYGPYKVTINGDGTETWKEADWSITIPSHLTRSDCE